MSSSETGALPIGRMGQTAPSVPPENVSGNTVRANEFGGSDPTPAYCQGRAYNGSALRLARPPLSFSRRGAGGEGVPTPYPLHEGPGVRSGVSVGGLCAVVAAVSIVRRVVPGRSP